MVRSDRLHRDLSAQEGLEPLDAIALARFQVMRHLGMDPDHHVAAVALTRPGLDLPEDLGGQGRVGLDYAATLAGRARGAEQRLEALPDTLASHLDQAQLRDLQHVGAGLVSAS